MATSFSSTKQKQLLRSMNTLMKMKPGQEAGKPKADGKKISRGLPVNPVEHKMSEEELIAEFGEDGWYELEDEIYRRYSFTPMKVEIEEHHVGVYKS